MQLGSDVLVPDLPEMPFEARYIDVWEIFVDVADVVDYFSEDEVRNEVFFWGLGKK